jgi:uncharacterized protein YjeT (DUF2065 family)
MSDAQIFQVFSIVYIALGVGIVIGPGYYKKMLEGLLDNAAVLYVGGVCALAIGYLIVAFHNTWTADLSVIITIVGWAALLKGILILVWPKMLIAISKAILSSEGIMRIAGVLIAVIGLAFSFLGFCPLSPIPAL